uniref:Uncharacterized protein n=2 Tax=Caenorhabditis japonica TaxID=281687 RepID=A0A8R1EEZ3_CAEJA
MVATSKRAHPVVSEREEKKEKSLRFYNHSLLCGRRAPSIKTIKMTTIFVIDTHSEQRPAPLHHPLQHQQQQQQPQRGGGGVSSLDTTTMSTSSKVSRKGS